MNFQEQPSPNNPTPSGPSSAPQGSEGSAPAPSASPPSAPAPAPGNTPSPPKAPPSDAAAKEAAPEAAPSAEEASKESSKKTLWQKVFTYLKEKRFLRRHILFYLVVVLIAFIIIWIFATGWVAYKAGENESWFQEIVGSLFLIFLGVLSYFHIYKKSRVYQAYQEMMERRRREEEERKRREEEQKKQAVFLKLIQDYEGAKTHEEKVHAMTKLLTVGLESPSLRQRVVDILAKENEWMRNHAAFLRMQNLTAWRLKKEYFEYSDRFPVGTEWQDLSVKALNILEAIIKKHILEFKNQQVKEVLDLSGKVLPGLTFTGQYFPAGSVLFEEAILWRVSFAEAILDRISFKHADLFGASFWRAKLRDIDVEGAILKMAKFRTDIQRVRNLTAEQFFSTKEWELCFLSREQIFEFFKNQEEGDLRWEKWASAQPRRERLYFNFQQI